MDLKTVVRNLKEQSIARAKDHEVPLKSAAPRQKRWATKSKTGCATCRIRRIKCDEGKPHCQRCVLTGRQCSGYATPATPVADPDAVSSSSVSLSHAHAQSPEPSLSISLSLSPEPDVVPAPAPAPPPPASPPASAHSPSSSSSSSSSKALVRVPRANHHPDFHIMDAIRYFGSVMMKEEAFHNPGDGIFKTTFKPNLHVDKITSRESFIALVVTDRIVNASAQAGVLPRQGNLPGINHLWSLLYRHIDVVIKDLNSRIAGGAAIETLLRRLVDLLSIDLSIMDPAWRSHVEGFAALVKLHGGVQKVINVKAALERDQRVPPMALHYVLIYSTLANTTSPASNQITGLANWSADDIAAAYSHTGFHPAPCPTSVLQDIVRITRLRTMCLAEPTITSAFVPIAHEVSRLLQAFAPEEWTEPYAKPEDPCMPLAGDLYKTASILYGLLSLPPVLAAEFATIPGVPGVPGASPSAMSGPSAVAVETARLFYGAYLMSLVDRAMDELPLPQGVSWPIAVLGVAKHDAPREDKDRLIGHLRTLRLRPGADSGAANIDIKLRDFWYFGHSKWEECYHEPINVIT